MIHFLNTRGSGILLHLSSLSSAHGIGDMGPAAHGWLRYLKQAGQHFWQVLPLNPTNGVFDHSPYMSFSALAGNPLFISPELLQEEGLLSEKEAKPPPFSPYLVDYSTVAHHKQQLLDRAWQLFKQKSGQSALLRFRQKNPWVEEHGLFMALLEDNGLAPWYTWPAALRNRQQEAMRAAREKLHERIAYFCFEQMLFFQQWEKLRRTARSAGIRIIGDLPIYVALDSVDVWANQEIFALSGKTGLPSQVAGVPPDYFSDTGQRWGNPLYRWQDRDPAIRSRLADWWETRLGLCLSLMDCIRIDHFRGFASYWAVPAKEKTAMNGRWKKGPGLHFFQEMERRLGPLPVIAEDLGIITPDVEALRRDLGFPGMKILLFAFDGNPANAYLNHNIEPDSVVYTGTHDNDTAVGWYLRAEPAAKHQAKQYANRVDDDASRFHRDMIHCAMISPARLVILPMQDVLGFGNDCRMNTPGTPTGNWRWRLAEHFLTDETAAWLREQTALHGRLDDTAGQKP